MGNQVGGNIIRAFEAGRRAKMEREQSAKEEEARKLRIDLLKEQITREKNASKLAIFNAQQGTLGEMVSGLPAQFQPAQQQQMPGGEVATAPPEMTPAIPPAELPHPAMNFEVPGGGTVSMQPQNIAETEQAKMRDLMNSIAMEQRKRQALPEYIMGAPGATPVEKYTGQAGTTLPATEKPPSIPSDIQEYLFYASQEQQGGRKPMLYQQWRMTKPPSTSIVNQPDKILTPAEASQLGVPYGTTREGAYGKTPSRPLTDFQRQSAETEISTLDSAISVMDKIGPKLDRFKSAVSGIHFQAALNAAREAGRSGLIGTAYNAAITRSLDPKDRELLGDWLSAQEHVQRMRAVMKGAAGFRSVEAFETLLAQIGNAAVDPATAKATFKNTRSTLKGFRDVLDRSLKKGVEIPEAQVGGEQPAGVTATPPPGATMKVPGSDGKLHWSDGQRDLGVAE